MYIIMLWYVVSYEGCMVNLHFSQMCNPLNEQTYI